MYQKFSYVEHGMECTCKFVTLHSIRESWSCCMNKPISVHEYNIAKNKKKSSAMQYLKSIFTWNKLVHQFVVFFFAFNKF